MSIDKKVVVVIQCDGCGEKHEMEDGTIPEAKQYLRERLGWRFRRDYEFCGDCDVNEVP